MSPKLFELSQAIFSKRFRTITSNHHSTQSEVVRLLFTENSPLNFKTFACTKVNEVSVIIVMKLFLLETDDPGLSAICKWLCCLHQKLQPQHFYLHLPTPPMQLKERTSL